MKELRMRELKSMRETSNTLPLLLVFFDTLSEMVHHEECVCLRNQRITMASTNTL